MLCRVHLGIYFHDPDFLKGQDKYLYKLDKCFFKIAQRTNKTVNCINTPDATIGQKRFNGLDILIISSKTVKTINYGDVFEDFI